MSLRRAFFFLFILLFVRLQFPGKPVSAGDEWLPIDPADLKMTSEPKAPGAPAIYLYRQVDRKDASRASTEYNYVRIKILTEEGRDKGNIVIPYRSERVHISGVKARTVHSDGSIVNFNGQVLEQMVEKTKGVKIKAKVFTAPDVQVGSIVEYHFNYDFEDQYIFDSYWSVSDDLFTRKAVFSLVPFERWPIQWAWPAGLPAGTEPPKQGADNIVRMTAADISAFQAEDYMPPENEFRFRVIFIYNEEGFESDPAKFWKKFGKKQNDRMESFVGKRKELEAAVSQIVAPGDAPEIKLQKIYARVEQLRNLSYEAPKSEQEEKREKLKKVENAADVLKNGYGTGWDITYTFLGLARAAGLETYGVMMSRRSEYYFKQKRMNEHELDSNGVMVKVNGKELFFDPGSLYVPYGLLPWQETGVEALKLDKDGGTWIQTPVPDDAASQIQRTANLKLTDDGTLDGTVKLTFTGLEAWSRRLWERNADDEARKKYLEEALQGYVPATTEVELTKEPDWKSTEPPLVAEFQVKIPGWVSAAGRRALLPVGIFGASEKHMFDHADRVYPISFDYPYQMRDDVTVALPNGWTATTLPQPVNRDHKDAQYTLTVEGKKDQLHISRMVRSNLVILPKDAYPALRGFYQEVRSGDDQQIVLQPGTVAAAH